MQECDSSGKNNAKTTSATGISVGMIFSGGSLQSCWDGDVSGGGCLRLLFVGNVFLACDVSLSDFCIFFRGECLFTGLFLFQEGIALDGLGDIGLEQLVIAITQACCIRGVNRNRCGG